jgi:hypothetical protein
VKLFTLCRTTTFPAATRPTRGLGYTFLGCTSRPTRRDLAALQYLAIAKDNQIIVGLCRPSPFHQITAVHETASLARTEFRNIHRIYRDRRFCVEVLGYLGWQGARHRVIANGTTTCGQEESKIRVKTNVELIAYRTALPQRTTNIWNTTCAIRS